MNTLKSIKQTSIEAQAEGAGRRSFIRKAGGALSALFASTAVVAGAPASGEMENLRAEVKRLSGQLGASEDTAAIRALHDAYGEYLGTGGYESIVELFAVDGEVHFNSQVFSGRDAGIRRLYLESFGQGLNGGYDGPVHRLMQADPAQREVIEVAPDRRTATARFPHLMQVWTRDNAEFPTMDLARAQGQGILRHVERGVHLLTCAKEADSWRIRRLEYLQAGDSVPAPAWRNAGMNGVLPGV